MIKIGEYNMLTVARKEGRAFILKTGGEEIPLDRIPKEMDIEIGETLEVFVYTKTDGTPVATISTPYATINEFACMTVVDINRFGAFLDWGIEKDLFVHRKEQQYQMKKGKKYPVYVCLDKSGRKVQGTGQIEQYFNNDTSKLKQGDKVNLMIYAITEIGIMAIVNNQYSGMLYINECFEKVKIGDIKQGYIKKIRQDGKIDLTLYAHIEKTISDAKTGILEKLTASGGFMPYHDKSDPEEIKLTFNMSKKNFKKAIGGLYKEQKIDLTGRGIKLK